MPATELILTEAIGVINDLLRVSITTVIDDLLIEKVIAEDNLVFHKANIVGQQPRIKEHEETIKRCGIEIDALEKKLVSICGSTGTSARASPARGVAKVQ